MPRVVSDVYMCTTARPVLTRSQSFLYTSTAWHNLNHLCIEPFSIAARPLSLFHRFSPLGWPRVVVPVPGSCSEHTLGAVRLSVSFPKRARSIVRSPASKGSRGIACPKPFISVSGRRVSPFGRDISISFASPPGDKVSRGGDVMKRQSMPGKTTNVDVSISISKYRSIATFVGYP